jgi:hypothetical protein
MRRVTSPGQASLERGRSHETELHFFDGLGLVSLDGKIYSIPGGSI